MLDKVLKKAKELGFDDLQISVTSSEELELGIFKGEVVKNFLGNSKSYILKGIIDGKSSTMIIEKNHGEFNDNDTNKALNKLKEDILSVTAPFVNNIFGGSKEYPVIKEKEYDLDKYSSLDKINLLKEIETKCFAYDPRIELVPDLEYSETVSSLEIVNTKGLNLKKTNKYGVVVVGVTAAKSKDDPQKQMHYDVTVKTIFKEFNADEIVKNVCDEVLAQIGGYPCESKVYPVLMDKEAMRSLLAGFFSMFTGESALRGLTALKDELGKKVVNEKINIIDDPLNENSIQQDAFDGEGVATARKEVIKDGVFKMFLHNLKTAKAFNVEPTGNATLGGGIGPQNFHLANGDTDVNDAIKSMKEGVIIKGLQGLHAGLNPISGDFSAQSRGFLVKDGKIERPVTLIVVSGNFLKMLNDVECVCNDLEFSYNGFGAPSVLFKGLPISGK